MHNGDLCVKDVPTTWSSGKIHGPQSVMVNLNCFGQRLGVPAITLTRHMAALGTVERRRTIIKWIIMDGIAVAVVQGNLFIQFRKKRESKRERDFAFWRSPVVFFVHQMVASTEGY